MAKVVAVDVQGSYARRAAEYVERLGSMAAMHPADNELIRTWATGVGGPVLDAGCGPGHWTNYLVEQGVAASGIDLVSEFIASARSRYPGVSYRIGSIDALEADAGTLGGILAWYSLIHHEPAAVQATLTEFARVIRPGGGLLLGFFDGPTIARFDHAVVAAYTWPVHEMTRQLHEAGFQVLDTHTRTGPDYRPHGAIVARRVSQP